MSFMIGVGSELGQLKPEDFIGSRDLPLMITSGVASLAISQALDVMCNPQDFQRDTQKLVRLASVAAVAGGVGGAIINAIGESSESYITKIAGLVGALAAVCVCPYFERSQEANAAGPQAR